MDYRPLSNDDAPRDSLDVRTEEIDKKREEERAEKARRKAEKKAAQKEAEKSPSKQSMLSSDGVAVSEKKKDKKKSSSSASSSSKKEKKEKKKKESAAPAPVERPVSTSLHSASSPVPSPREEKRDVTDLSSPTETAFEPKDGTFETFYCRALADWQGTEPGDLSIRYMQVIEILDMQPNGWWAGQIGDRVGWLPSNYCARVDPLEIFLQKNGLSKIYDKLVEEDVDLESLYLLTEEDLVGIGIKLGPRKQLLKVLADSKAGRKQQMSSSRDISHQEVRRTLSLRTGNVPNSEHVNRNSAAAGSSGKRRTSQFLQTATDEGAGGGGGGGEEPSEEGAAITDKAAASDAAATDGSPSAEDFLHAAVYLKVIIPEQNCYKILAFEGSMLVRDCVRRVSSKLAKPLKRPMSDYTFWMPDVAKPGRDELPMDTDGALGLYRPTNMACVVMRELKKKGFLQAIVGK